MSRKQYKIIVGKKHWLATCRKCFGRCWTRRRGIVYICDTCYNVKFIGGGLGTTPGEKCIRDD